MHGYYRAVVLSVLKELSVLPQTVTVQTSGQTSGAIPIWPGDGCHTGQPDILRLAWITAVNTIPALAARSAVSRHQCAL